MAEKHQYDVRISFQITKSGSGLQQVQDELRRVQGQNEKTSKNILTRWTELRSQILLIKFAFREVANAVGAFWESARGGAGITQLEESFNRANQEIFKTPTLLADLTAAARGTVTQAELMSGIMTVTAGVTREFSQALTENAGRLLEIAKAANRLNPVLGNTDFFYQSLTLGIKRSSYRILDNLGIVVRVGDANKRWAAEMGRTVESLTAEERQMALLNEVLRVGGRLVEQAGGSSASLTDTYDILTTSIKDMGNRFKQTLDAQVRPFIQGFADAKLAAIEFEAAIGHIITDRVIENWEDARRIINELKRELRETEAGNVEKVSGTIDVLVEAIRAIAPEAKTFGQIEAALRRLGFETSDVGVTVEGTNVSFIQLKAAILDILEAESKAAYQAERLAREHELLEHTDRTLLIPALEEQAELEKKLADARRQEGAIAKAVGEEDLRSYVIRLAEANYEVGQSLLSNKEFIRSLALLGINVDIAGVHLADETIRLSFLEKTALAARLEIDALAFYTQRLADAEQLAEQATRRHSRGVEEVGEATEFTTSEIMAADLAMYRASRTITSEFIPSWESLASVSESAAATVMQASMDLGTAFADAYHGGLTLLNKGLDELGPRLVTVGGRTADQNEILEDAREEYEKLSKEIARATAAPELYGKTTEELSEDIEKWIKRQEELLPLITRMEDITGSAALVTVEAAADIGAMNDALFEGVLGYERLIENADGTTTSIKATAEQMALLGLSLGTINEEQANAILKQVELVEGVKRITAAYVEQDLTADEAKEAMRILAEDGIAAMQRFLNEAVIPLSEQVRILRDRLRETAGVYRIEFQYTVGHIVAPEDVEIPYPEGGGGGTNPPPRRRPGGPQEPGGQYGLDTIVPPGYPNDSYRVWASSGERVVIQTPQQQATGGHSLQNIYQIDARGAAPGVGVEIRQALEEWDRKKGQRTDSLTRRRSY